MKIFTNIGAIVSAERHAPLRKIGSAMDSVEILRDAWLAIENDRIVDFGTMSDFPLEATNSDTEIIDVRGGWIFPSFCDSHTHIVYAGDRAGEFVDKINGLSYEEIGRRGGGILNSVDLLHKTSEDELFIQAKDRLDEMISKGTGAIEIKSGYGLSMRDELKMLRVIHRLSRSCPAIVKATFLGAHAVPRKPEGESATKEEWQEKYVAQICSEMIPEVSRQGIAEFVDVFCDEGYFTPDQTKRIIYAGANYGLRAKIHANELAVSGGVQVGVECGALSVDHLERSTPAEFAILKDSATMPTLLPGSSFFLGIPYADGRAMIDCGLAIALASDFNPGSSPSGDMRFVCSLGCIRMKLTPERAINAATLNSAYAMGVSDIVGSITPGKIANFFITQPLPSLEYFLYYYTFPMIKDVYLAGEKIEC